MSVGCGGRGVGEAGRAAFPPTYPAAMARMNGLRLCAVAGVAVAIAAAPGAYAQVRIVDTPGSAPVTQAAPAKVDARAAKSSPPGTSPAQGATVSKDAETMAQARRFLAEGKPGRALSLMDTWIANYERREKKTSLAGEFIGWLFRDPTPARNTAEFWRAYEESRAYVPEAFYLRGNAKLAMGNEFDALYDYEEVIKYYPESEQFVPCLERELQVSRLYLNGLDKPSAFFGIRWGDGHYLAEEIILRLAERLPGSRLAERALLDLADYYARSRDLNLAAESYDVFLRLYPKSEFRSLAMQRRVFANIARFKGPGYDASSLKDAMVQIEEFQQEFPAEAQRTGVSDALQARVDESAAACLMKSARWYLDRNDLVSARLTLTRLVKRHPRTGCAQEAVAELQKIDVRTGRATNAAGAESTP